MYYSRILYLEYIIYLTEMSRGSRVIRCTGNIKKEVRSKLWHSLDFSKLEMTSENLGLFDLM